ncbi:MAG: hypothetical protein M1150_03775 [Patescibacteria group bacterium]|nr:hypothetical protein [Patescibacteria group bacterium]
MKTLLTLNPVDKVEFNVSNSAVSYPDPSRGGLALLIGNLWTTAVIIGGLLFLIYLLIGGIQWITSGGDKAGLESARGKIVNALIGLGILVASFAIIKIVETLFGIKILDLNIPAPIGITNPH